ncbi:mechanosensitive ion channel [Lysobacter sp. SG-8]|uniref:Mechanosensitive ion channel n=1 Tax=Marilutibacter penaei TaxID=2759900 RepID=A0A7W3YE48_9GAMM|nr:mechanosensitive ion channel domain-containing protein [Lysobacter penaei]MBB1087841.1 mechanosensitive ion channel [Lysobacter penaei]
MPVRLLSLLLLVALGLQSALAPGPAMAQDAQGTTASEAGADGAAKDAGPQAIPVTELQDRADTDERFAEQVILRAGTEAASQHLGTELDAIIQSIQQKSTSFDTATLRALPVSYLDGLERHWKFDQRRLQEWDASLHASSDPYSKAAADLGQRRAEWQATLAAAESKGLASALLDQARQVIERLNEAEQALSPPLERYIELGRRANTAEAQIESGLAVVSDAIVHINRRLFHADSQPLADLAAGQAMQRNAMAALQQGIESEGRFISDYSASNHYNQRVLLVLQLALLPLLLWLSRHSRRRLADDAGGDGDSHAVQTDESSRRVLQRPLSSWLMLSMIGVLVFEPEAPLVLHQLAALVALVPVLRLLPPHAYRLLGPWPLVATGIYLLLRLATLLTPNVYLYRWYFLVLGVAAIALSAWLLLRARHGNLAQRTGRTGKALVAALWVSIVLLSIATIANVVGAFALSEMLVRGVVDCGYMALLLYVGLVVFKALMHLLIQERQRFRFRLSRDHATPLLDLLQRLATWTAVGGWIMFAMIRFRIFRPIEAWVTGVLGHEFGIGAITFSLGHVLVFVFGVFIAFWVAKTMRFILAEEITPRMSLPRGVGNSIASLSYYALLLVGLLVALSAAGFKVGQLTFIFGALGVGIGFGLQTVVNNFVSGLILMFERPIQPGDVVDIGTTSGNVREIGMRATTIKTFEGADVVVPNGSLLSENLTNWTLRDMFRRIEVKFGVAYGADPEQVIELIMGVLASEPGVSTHPEPRVFFMEFGASSLDFSARAWTRDYDNWLAIRSHLMIRIYATLNENGIEIPFPQRDLHLRSVSDEARDRLIEGARADGPPAPGTPSAAG